MNRVKFYDAEGYHKHTVTKPHKKAALDKLIPFKHVVAEAAHRGFYTKRNMPK